MRDFGAVGVWLFTFGRSRKQLNVEEYKGELLSLAALSCGMLVLSLLTSGYFLTPITDLPSSAVDNTVACSGDEMREGCQQLPSSRSP